jgi:hypothetical protein
MGWTIHWVQTFIRLVQNAFSESDYITAYNFCHRLPA